MWPVQFHRLLKRVGERETDRLTEREGGLARRKDVLENSDMESKTEDW